MRDVTFLMHLKNKLSRAGTANWGCQASCQRGLWGASPLAKSVKAKVFETVGDRDRSNTHSIPEIEAQRSQFCPLPPLGGDCAPRICIRDSQFALTPDSAGKLCCPSARNYEVNLQASLQETHLCDPTTDYWLSPTSYWLRLELACCASLRKPAMPPL